MRIYKNTTVVQILQKIHLKKITLKITMTWAIAMEQKGYNWKI